MSAVYSGSGPKTFRKIGKSMRTEIAAYATPASRPGTSPGLPNIPKESNDTATAQATPITVIRLSNSARLLCRTPNRTKATKKGTNHKMNP
jgi:hypothetical protein